MYKKLHALLRRHLVDKGGAFKIDIVRSPLFLFVLILKLVAAALFASDFLVKFFAPFVNYFVASGFQNPYEFFYRAGLLLSFPYPTVMLWILSIPRFLMSPFVGIDYTVVSNFHIFLYRLPLLFADTVICLILARWLKNSTKKVLWYYWCSPVLFYITYIHGQLDVIPIMFLFMFLYFLFKERWYLAPVFLGLAIASKTHIAMLVPFVLVYLLLKKRDWIQTMFFLGIAALVFVALNYHYLSTPGFVEMVLKAREQFRVFDFQLGFNDRFVIYLVPVAYAALFMKSLTYRTFNRDIFLMFLGFAFGILTFFIPPMQGWYFWVLPFLIYFYIKERSALQSSFIALNVLYFAYFLVVRQSDFFQVFQLILPAVAATPNVYHLIANAGYNPDTVVNVVFSFLQTVLLINVFWVYRKGIESNARYKMHYQPYLIGLTGDSGSGKTTLARLIQNVFGERNTAIVQGDDVHKWERGNEMWNMFTHLDPRATELHTDLEHALSLKHGTAVKRRRYDHDVGRFTLPRKLDSKSIVVFEGLHSLFLSKMRTLLDLKVFIRPDETLRRHWKVLRDTKERGYTREKVVEQLKKRQGDSKEYIQAQEQYSDVVISVKNKKKVGAMLGDERAPLELCVEFSCTNDVNMDPLLLALAQAGTVECRHSFHDDRQSVEICGHASAQEIEKVAYVLVPELWEVVVHDPVWAQGYQGLIQLFMCYYIFERMKLERYEEQHKR